MESPLVNPPDGKHIVESSPTSRTFGLGRLCKGISRKIYRPLGDSTYAKTPCGNATKNLLPRPYARVQSYHSPRGNEWKCGPPMALSAEPEKRHTTRTPSRNVYYCDDFIIAPYRLLRRFAS